MGQEILQGLEVCEPPGPKENYKSCTHDLSPALPRKIPTITPTRNIKIIIWSLFVVCIAPQKNSPTRRGKRVVYDTLRIKKTRILGRLCRFGPDSTNPGRGLDSNKCGAWYEIFGKKFSHHLFGREAKCFFEVWSIWKILPVTTPSPTV